MERLAAGHACWVYTGLKRVFLFVAQPERSHLALALGGGPLLDWLLEAATECDSAAATDRAEQEQAQRALAFLLQSGEAGTLVLQPRAFFRVLRLVYPTGATGCPTQFAFVVCRCR